MKILFITDNFPPEVNAPATRTYEHSLEWIKKGVDVTIITSAPNFPNGKVYKGYKNRLYQKGNIDGIEVIRVWSYISANEGFIKRVLDYISFSISAFFVGVFCKFDIVVATSPQFFTTWSAFLLSKFRRKPWVFELRDIWPESIQSVGAMRHQRILNILEKIELGLYRDSNQVIAVTNSFKQNLISRGIEKSKISVVTNGSNLELFYSRDKDQELLNKLNLNNKFIIGYIGTHGMAHGLDFIIRAISKIDSSIHFLFVGNGAMKEIIVNLAKELNIKNVTFIEPIPKDEVPRYLSIVDVSLVPLKKSNTFKGVIPSKIFEASSMRIPTLLGVEGEVKGIIESYNAGISYEPENEEDFISKVYELKYNKKLYENIQKNSIKLAIDYNRKILANKMLNILQSIAKKKKKKVLFLKGKTV